MSSGRKVMLIAGGSGSVGSAIAREAARQGWAVAIHGRSGDKLAALTAEIEGAQGIAVDIHAEDAAQRLVAETVAKFRRIDAVVDCTATGPSEGRITGLFKDTTPETYGAFLNLSAAWFQRLSHAAYPHLAKQGGTLIAFISDAGRFAAPRQTIIGSARAATIGFVR
jgi:NAD(P)-dependent dehydrogenase (short-subunit alcohol dehydrogenase family)